MRSGKTHGGLINITHKDTAQENVLTTAHVMVEYSEALRALTGITSGSMSEQHREMGKSRCSTDAKHLHIFEEFLTNHNPFTLGESHQLINISSGVVADSRVKVNDSFKIGMDINNGVKFDDIKFKINDQAVLFSVMR